MTKEYFERQWAKISNCSNANSTYDEWVENVILAAELLDKEVVVDKNDWYFTECYKCGTSALDVWDEEEDF